MMNYSNQELEVLLHDLESDRVERKESWGGDAPDKGRQAVCAFANDLPGYEKPGVLFVGIKDNGLPSGLLITDDLLKTLSDMKTDGNILPPPTLVVQKRVLKGAEVAVVVVQPADSPPVRYKGRIWIRIGPRRGISTVQDERILNEKRRHKDLAYELHPVERAKISDLNRLLFEEQYLRNAFADDILDNDQRSYEQRLAVCGMVSSADQPVPTVLGLLSLGLNQRHFIPGAYIQFLRFGGCDYSDSIIDEELIEGDLIRLITRIDDKMGAHNRVRVDITSGPLERRTYLYPPDAFIQLVRNAVMHRNYEGTNAPVKVCWFDDRIEIISPGGPFGAINLSNFGVVGLADYRNPRLADTMKVLGFVQRFGVGIQIAQAAMRENGSPPIEFAVDSNWVKCTLRVHPEMLEYLESGRTSVRETKAFAPVNAPVNAPVSALQRSVLNLIWEDNRISYKAMATRLNKDRSTIMRNIRVLKQSGMLQRVGSDKAGHWEIIEDDA